MHQKKRIGIIVAQEEESTPLKSLLRELNIFIQNNTDIDIFLYTASGVGMLNAAYATNILINEYHVDEIMNVGVVAGRGDLNVGDLVLVDEVYNGDFDISVFNHDKYYMPEIGNSISGLLDGVDLNLRRVPCFTISRFLEGDIDTSIEDYVVDMEYYGIAYMCKKYEIPHYYAIKCVSDTAKNDSNKEYEENLKDCSTHMARYIVDYLLDKYTIVR